MKYRVFEKVTLWKESIVEIKDYNDTITKKVQALQDGDAEYLKSVYLVETEEPAGTKELWSFKTHDSKPIWSSDTNNIEGNLFTE